MSNKQYTLQYIAEFLGAKLAGDSNDIIDSIASLNKAQSNQISFCKQPSYKKQLAATKAGAVILHPDMAKHYQGNALLTDNPYASYAKLTSLFIQQLPNTGIHPSAVIGKNVTIGKNSYIGPNCSIQDNVTIGNNCYLYSNVAIYHDVSIGNSVIIHSGAIIGADGFGMANEQGKWLKIHQLGNVIIGNNVEIGANTCIDRGALENTIIEDGVKLDNLIQIGHNVRVGAHTVISGCCAIGGSTSIGRYCMIGGATAISDHINIADQTIITGGSTVGRHINKPGIYSSAVTVHPHRVWLKAVANLPKLGQINEIIRNITKSEEAS